MCTVLLPPGDNPIAVNKYIISYQKFFRRFYEICFTVCPKFILLTGGRAGILNNKQNST